MNNIKPRTREERDALSNKEVIEKSRINQRIGLETRKTDVKDLLHNSQPDSTLFASGKATKNILKLENERFDKDFATNDKKKRIEEQQKKALILEKHRLEALERDANRWEKMESEEKKAEMKQDFKREVLKQGKRNHNGMPYNPITLEYHPDEQGQDLMSRDEQAKVRAYLRATNLDSRSNCGYNVLTGDSRKEVVIPENLQEKYKGKIQEAYEKNALKNYQNASNRLY